MTDATKSLRMSFYMRPLVVADCAKCPTCQEVKTADHFHIDYYTKTGLYGQCKECHKKRRKYNNEKRRATRAKYRKQETEYVKTKRKECPEFKIAHNLRVRLSEVVRKDYKNTTMTDMLGCSVSFFKKHLESQFKEGMNWENYGRGGWHIDHIYPCSGFDLTNPEDQKRCFHYSNMRPLWESENLSKGGKVSKNQPKPLALTYE